VREVSGRELVELAGDPFVRHQVDPALVRGAWVHGAAAVVRARPHLPGAEGDLVTMVGPADALRELAGHVAARTSAPWRVTVPLEAREVLPPAWRHTEHRRWHWMLTRRAPASASSPSSAACAGPARPGEPAVEEVGDAAEVDALLDAGAPGAHARPGSPGIECWLGLREAGVLQAVGALVRQPDGTGHLRAVTVLPEARGRGYGRTLSRALTRRALAGRSGVATLGVYVENDPAVAIYRGLGYSVVHTFASGPVS
jgi:ribosomal protein S18 acetylase RimI-like enzyme